MIFRHVFAAVAVVVLASLLGCHDADSRVADLAQQTTHEQSEQNQRIAEGSRALAEGSQQLVQHDAVARRELVGLQQDLRKDLAEVGKQRDELEEERQLIAGQRVQDSKGGALCVGLAIILVCLAPLLLAGMSLLGLWRAPTTEEEGRVLIEELSAVLAQNALENSTEPPRIGGQRLADTGGSSRSPSAS